MKVVCTVLRVHVGVVRQTVECEYHVHFFRLVPVLDGELTFDVQDAVEDFPHSFIRLLESERRRRLA